MVGGLPDNFFRINSPADIIAQVAVTTLAVISGYDEEELRRIGWLDSEIVKILYSLSDAGVWEPRRGGLMVSDGELVKVALTGATAIEITDQEDYDGIRLLTAYQDSGGALVLSIVRHSDDEVIATQSVANSALTYLEFRDFVVYPKLKLKLSDAGGVNQNVWYQRYRRVRS